MKRLLSVFLLAFMVLTSVQAAPSAKPVQVEVLYMNHGPLQDSLDKMKGLFSKFGDKITVSWHDFESSEGAQFKAKKNITQHVPLLIWIDGNTTVKLSHKEVKFMGFPSGAGPVFFQGSWTLDDLKEALTIATTPK
jgi:hypothetical protein